MKELLPHNHFLCESTFKQTCFSYLLEEDSLKIPPEVDSSRFLFDVESLDVFLVECSSSFLLLNIPFAETSSSSSYYLLNEVSTYNVDSLEGNY